MQQALAQPRLEASDALVIDRLNLSIAHLNFTPPLTVSSCISLLCRLEGNKVGRKIGPLGAEGLAA
jgi:hypothetical protein